MPAHHLLQLDRGDGHCRKISLAMTYVSEACNGVLLVMHASHLHTHPHMLTNTHTHTLTPGTRMIFSHSQLVERISFLSPGFLQTLSSIPPTMMKSRRVHQLYRLRRAGASTWSLISLITLADAVVVWSFPTLSSLSLIAMKFCVSLDSLSSSCYSCGHLPILTLICGIVHAPSATCEQRLTLS